MERKTNHAFIIYKVKGNLPVGGATFGLSFAASLPDKKAAQKWIMEEGKKRVNYTILEVFRNE